MNSWIISRLTFTEQLHQLRVSTSYFSFWCWFQKAQAIPKSLGCQAKLPLFFVNTGNTLKYYFVILSQNKTQEKKVNIWKLHTHYNAKKSWNMEPAENEQIILPELISGTHAGILLMCI